MSAASKVILIFGAGPRVGAGIADAFASNGYKIALASRTPNAQTDGLHRIHIPCDLSDPASVPGAFSKTRELLGVPSVVVYNAYGGNPTDYRDPLALPVDVFARNLTINTTSVYAAAQQARECFAELPSSAARAFIYTGNSLNERICAPLMDLGVGKTATAHLIEYLAEAYALRGFKFYYADQRKADGSPMWAGLDAEAHGKFYLELAEGEQSQGQWQQTFVKGGGV
ncbi:hypothetical protein N7468_001437 [Penicillium chermesinum]|uniref:Uncharacterized protein n=1 Tax=Penicillium chermesinum TaxID=63820 RepID=A0A9W9PGI9_9EURO|nr:uncharacterized protein N7468_001437 [Penicillium chermesinum]KAJ5246454.1 hypothetical protein N7468_001437 [Penicillium chermesinum]